MGAHFGKERPRRGRNQGQSLQPGNDHYQTVRLHIWPIFAKKCQKFADINGASGNSVAGF